MPGLACDFLSGESILLFTYGQNDSGKTYTLFGSSREKGLIQKTCENLIKDFNVKSLTCSFVEIFQENIYDLLFATVKDEKNKVLELMKEEVLSVPAQVEEVLKSLQRRVGGGKGHSIFTLGISGKAQKFVFVDLAGSERQRSAFASSEKAKENSMINKGLSSLDNVIKGLASGSGYINYRDSKLTFLLKDFFLNSKIVLIAAVVTNKKAFLDTIGTIKFAQRVKRLKKFEPDQEQMETISELQGKIEEMRKILEIYKNIEEDYINLQREHCQCEKIMKNDKEKILDLEDEVQMLRKEILENNKIENSDWLLSSDSEDNETLFQLNKEKNGLEVSLAAAQEKLEEKNKEIINVLDRLEGCERDKESQAKLIQQLNSEAEELNSKCNKLQELCLLLGTLNSNLASEMKVGSDISDHPDLSYMSSTDSSKMEIFKIIEEKDAKASNLAENFKETEESFHKLREKYFTDTMNLKKQIARLKKELEITKAENIKDNDYAMTVLEGLKAEKKRLLTFIEAVSEGSDRRKIQELKEVNNLLIENLKVKGQQISDLQRKFQEFLMDSQNTETLKCKLMKKKEKIKELKTEFFKIRAHIIKFPQFRKKLENLGLAECLIDIFSSFNPRKNKSGSIYDLEKLGLYF
jgi:chromosome segregation ATPase